MEDNKDMVKKYSSRQLQILISALNLIEIDGFRNLTIKNLAKVNCITDGAIYKHFKSKDETSMMALNTHSLFRFIGKHD